MSLIEWNDEFSVGISAVDHEHRELIGLINELYANLSGGAPEITIVDFLGELYARISAHFALEEKIMRDRKYDQYEDHKADHERLLDEIRDIMDDYDDNESFSEEILGERLKSWFSDHFKTKDARFYKHLV